MDIRKEEGSEGESEGESEGSEGVSKRSRVRVLSGQSSKVKGQSIRRSKSRLVKESASRTEESEC